MREELEFGHLFALCPSEALTEKTQFSYKGKKYLPVNLGKRGFEVSNDTEKSSVLGQNF